MQLRRLFRLQAMARGRVDRQPQRAQQQHRERHLPGQEDIDHRIDRALRPQQRDHDQHQRRQRQQHHQTEHREAEPGQQHHPGAVRRRRAARLVLQALDQRLSAALGGGLGHADTPEEAFGGSRARSLRARSLQTRSRGSRS
jgi:hypothetical protein